MKFAEFFQHILQLTTFNFLVTLSLKKTPSVLWHIWETATENVKAFIEKSISMVHLEVMDN